MATVVGSRASAMVSVSPAATSAPVATSVTTTESAAPDGAETLTATSVIGPVARARNRWRTVLPPAPPTDSKSTATAGPTSASAASSAGTAAATKMSSAPVS